MAFRKGDAVHLIVNYDTYGTVRITPATVYSCGKKQMVLTETATGLELGRHYSPTGESWSVITTSEPDIAKVEAVALALAEKVIAQQAAHFTRCLSGGHGEGYDRAIRKEQARLHEPRILWDRKEAA